MDNDGDSIDRSGENGGRKVPGVLRGFSPGFHGYPYNDLRSTIGL